MKQKHPESGQQVPRLERLLQHRKPARSSRCRLSNRVRHCRSSYCSSWCELSSPCGMHGACPRSACRNASCRRPWYRSSRCQHRTLVRSSRRRCRHRTLARSNRYQHRKLARSISICCRPPRSQWLYSFSNRPSAMIRPIAPSRAADNSGVSNAVRIV